MTLWETAALSICATDVTMRWTRRAVQLFQFWLEERSYGLVGGRVRPRWWQR